MVRMKLGILSDTHIDEFSPVGVPDWILTAFGGVDLILHAGDIVCQSVLEELEQVAPVLAVRGNSDLDLRNLPISRVVSVDGGLVGLAHLLQDARRLQQPGVCLLVHGHTHVGEIVREEGLWRINPGSARKPRGGGPPSVVVATVVAGMVAAEFKYPPRPADE